MRLDKLTTKSQEALQQAQGLADKRNHQAIDVEHLLFALIGQKEGVSASLLQKLGVPLGVLTDRLQKILDRLPQVTGGAGQSYITPRLKKTIENAESEAESLKDEYVSAEHLLLAMVQDSGEIGKFLKEQGATRDKILSALVSIRGAQRITDPNPEEKYQALEKYGRVLTEVTDAAGHIILFIDELHTLVGAGAAEGAMDASNMLKPALARGELRCV